ncbi:MAG TPA: ATP-binding protein [Gemmatimonadaceae bacterium]|nr:ATP-binding protein [Gemmatimonadaceae bacterium]
MATEATLVLDAIPDGVIVFGSDWRVLLVNRTAEMLLGLPRDEMEGKTLGRDLVYLDEARLAVYRDVMENREPRAMPGVELGGPGAGARIFDGHVYPAPSGGIVVVFRDMTGRARAEAGLREQTASLAQRLAAAEAEQRAAEVDSAGERQLLATLSHEMRTPLNAILGYAELLELHLAGPLTEEQRTHIERVRISARHLLDLVNAVLDLAKVEAGQVTTERGHGMAADAIHVALALVHPQIVARGVTIVDRSQGHAPVPYVGDVIRVRQILVNLLGNAAKFVHPGGRIEVSCRVAEHPDPDVRLAGAGPWACMRVEDSGIGIPPEDTERIFEPFVQLQTGRAHNGEGVGLGLAICRRLARLMSGDVSVRSRPGEGSIFSLWLPSPRAPSMPGPEPLPA